MIVRQTLQLDLLADGQILFLNLQMELFYPFPLLFYRPFYLVHVFRNYLDIVHVIRQIDLLVLSVNILLEMVFHLSVNRDHFWANTEIHHKLRQSRLSQKASVLLIKIIQHTVTDKAHRNREKEHPFIVETARAVFGHHDVLEQAVHIGGSKCLVLFHC